MNEIQVVNVIISWLLEDCDWKFWFIYELHNCGKFQRELTYCLLCVLSESSDCEVITLLNSENHIDNEI